MNINDIWNGLLSIYNRVTPAAILIIAFCIAVWFSAKRTSFKSKINSKLERIADSDNLKNLEQVLSLSHLTSLLPILAIVLFLMFFIVLGDAASWLGYSLPVPFATSYTPMDIFSEQRTPDDLAIVAVHLMSTNLFESEKDPTQEHNFPLLYDIYKHYDRECDRLRNKYPERYQSAGWGTSSSKAQTLYSGFFILTILFLVQLIFRKKKSQWLWFGYTTAPRTIVVLLILILLTSNYRLEWEWSTESAISARIRITADILYEEVTDDSVEVTNELLAWIEQEQNNYEPRRLWLARYYDVITMNLRNISHRQLN